MHKNKNFQLKFLFFSYIGIKIKFETNLKFYFVTYNTKNKILSLNILFVGYKRVLIGLFLGLY